MLCSEAMLQVADSKDVVERDCARLYACAHQMGRRASAQPGGLEATRMLSIAPSGGSADGAAQLFSGNEATTPNWYRSNSLPQLS